MHNRHGKRGGGVSEDHANPRKRWIALGSPEYPDQGTIAELIEHSRLVREPARIKRTKTGLEIDVTVPPHRVAAITLES